MGVIFILIFRLSLICHAMQFVGVTLVVTWGKVMCEMEHN